MPSTKAAQCRRHAATLGLQVPSDCSGEGIDGSSMRDGLGHSGSSSSSSSSQSYGERSSSSGTNGNMEDASLENTGSSSSSSREANGVSSKRRSHLVKEDQPEQERQCSISTRYNGQRGSERCDKVREKQEVGSLNGRGSDSYGLSPSARKRMRVDVSEASNEMSRITRTGLSAASNVSSSSQNPIDLCEDDSDVTTAETSDLHTGGTPDTPTSSDVALDVAAPQIAVTDVKMNMDEIVETTDAIGLETALFDQPTLEVDSSACVEL